MSPLLGRPRLNGHHLALRSALLLIALLLAAAPLSSLLEGTSWLTLTATGAIPVIGAGYLARLVVPFAVLVPVIQALSILALVLVVQVQQGLVRLADGPRGILEAQPAIYAAGANELAAGIAPLTVGARGTVIVVLLCSLISLALDLMFVDLGWHTSTGVVLMAFLLVPALQQPTGGPWWTLAGPVLAGLLIFAARTLHADPSYVIGDRRPQAGPLAHPLRTTGAVLAISALVAGLAGPVGRALPNLADPRVALNINLVNQWQNRDLPQLGPVMIDDDVSVRRSLLDQDPVEVLRYTSTAEDPPYLRLRTLNTFDGEAYTASGDHDLEDLRSFSDARETGRAVAGGTLYEHDMLIANLGGDRLPVPENLRSLDLDDADESEGTHVLPTSGEVALQGTGPVLTGATYRAVSEQHPAGADALRQVDPAHLQAPFDEGYIRADEVPQVTADLAASIAADAEATTAFDTAIAFQEFFRSGFAYSLTVRTPPGEDPLESFLSDRIGYCEQFAAAFALMMTSQGYPTRVAIGFTAGEHDGAEWVVRSANAHAWPEVWFGREHGWIAFEPTPAAASNGVRVPDVTDPATQSETAPTEVPAPEAEAATPVAGTEDDTGTEQTEGAQDDGEDAGSAAQTKEDAAGDGPGAAAVTDAVVRVATVLLGVVGGVTAAAAAAVLGIRRRRETLRERRWAAVTDRADMAESTGVTPSVDAADGATAGRADGQREILRRRAGEIAWADLEAELRGRELAVRWLGWTGAWGRPPRQLVLNPALPPPAALDRLLDDMVAGPAEPVHGSGPDPREAAARIADAVTVARYAAPEQTGSGAAASANQSAALGPEALRRDADLLVELIRRAR